MRTFELRTNVTRYRTPEEQLELLDAGALSYDAKLYIYVGQVENFYQGHAMLDNEFYSVLAKNVKDEGIEFLLFNEYEIFSVTYTNKNRDNNFFVRKIEIDGYGYSPKLYGFGNGKVCPISYNTLQTTNYVFNQFAKFLPKQNKNNLQFAVSKICGHDSRVINLSEKALNLLNEFEPIIYCDSQKRQQMAQIKFYYFYICAINEYVLKKMDVNLDEEVDFDEIIKKYLLKIHPKMNEYKIKLYQKLASEILDIQQTITINNEDLNFGLIMANMAINYDYFRDACMESVEEFIIKGLSEFIDDNKLPHVIDAYLDIYRGNQEVGQQLVEYAYSLKIDNEEKNAFNAAYLIFNDYCNKKKNIDKVEQLFKKCLIEYSKERKKIKEMINLAQTVDLFKS